MSVNWTRKEVITLLIFVGLGWLVGMAGKSAMRAWGRGAKGGSLAALEPEPPQALPRRSVNGQPTQPMQPTAAMPRRLPPPELNTPDPAVDADLLDTFEQPAVAAAIQPARSRLAPSAPVGQVDSQGARHESGSEEFVRKADLLALGQQLEASIRDQLARLASNASENGSEHDSAIGSSITAEQGSLDGAERLESNERQGSLSGVEQDDESGQLVADDRHTSDMLLAENAAPIELQPLTTLQRQRAYEAIRMVEPRVQELVTAGIDAGRRGAHYTARDKVLDALRLLTQSADAASNCRNRTQQLTEGLRAIEESADFAMTSDVLNNALPPERIVARHRSHVVAVEHARVMTHVALQRAYLERAQQSLASAARGSRAGSEALLGLAKFYLTRAATEGLKQQGPRAVALCQTALEVDPENHAAANELGALLAQYGKLTDAKEMLLRSLRAKPSVAAWQNLATVHQRLGEGELAQLAVQERQALQTAAPESRQPVGFVDPRTFAATHPGPHGSPMFQDAAQPAIPSQPKTAVIHRWTR